ncbi:MULTISPECIES: 6-pyruvoyl trahydropterin synthase family protein [Pseudorhizobium]|uniref:6-carboxy-5,6,7,8-tetrahydropterin synthase n=1 Tax=Pseudorhizobium pelagicum TaxID=1509405 RepID=A0A922P118_9HYPH|nr:MULTISPECIES: 6-carboxytetrahydropterin synthase [Pseudorhizobium]MBU1316963.1 6-carboxytetrahydropterin synthase [Alphaproteobacteria bacterium]KEQ07752.1 6-pyruvoyl tetrahydropterin synthase [Pseudorhizobium pelagicum]KEQ10493.1 6-pyruvoyl tetrahydropterin synthase [Pseudorhizobium pelagicum]MBU1548118.1 6-carboxytetrahydropterin synthase [Alphaproteobacteria bacterium]MBU2336120.1 6-carboxytetrahydropterin synthase [Alphaproteobacteria bacterium]
MFAVEVRDHIMIAHSLPRPVFGPAQGMHGATFVVDAAFFTADLDEDGLAVDIGLAMQVLGEVLKPLNYQNLDEVEEFAGKVTTTEFLAKFIFDQLAKAIAGGRLGDGSGRIRRLKVMLHESHTARGWYEADL